MTAARPKSAWIALFTAVLVWSSSYVGIRIGLTQFSPGSLALLRYFSASIAMFIVYIRLPHRYGLKLKDFPYIFILGAIGFALYNLTLNVGELTVQAATAGFLIALIPIGMIILARIFFREKLTKPILLGIGMSFAGIILISVGESNGFEINIGILYVLCSVIAGSIYSTFQKPFLKNYHPIEFSAYAIWSGTLALLIFTPHLVHQLPHASLKTILWAIYLGVFPAAIGYTSWSYVLRYFSTARAASILYVVPVISIFLGWLIIDEVPQVLTLIGCFIALAGAIFVNVKKRRPNPQKTVSDHQTKTST